jgi:hypothetical protein
LPVDQKINYLGAAEGRECTSKHSFFHLSFSVVVVFREIMVSDLKPKGVPLHHTHGSASNGPKERNSMTLLKFQLPS